MVHPAAKTPGASRAEARRLVPAREAWLDDTEGTPLPPAAGSVEEVEGVLILLLLALDAPGATIELV
jgi:hypothetical protein